MLKKVKKKPLPRALLLSGFLAMLAVNVFSLNISTIALMLAAGLVSLAVFLVKGGGRNVSA